MNNRPLSALDKACLEAKDKMRAEWATCNQGSMMLEYVAENLPETWPQYRRFVFVVSKLLQYEFRGKGPPQGLTYAMVDAAQSTAQRAIMWALYKRTCSYEWNDIECEVLREVQLGNYTAALAAAVPSTGPTYLYQLAQAMRVLSLRDDYESPKLSCLVREVFPNPPSKTNGQDLLSPEKPT